MSELSFPQFNWLPFELRDAIWTYFALTRGPMIHTISLKHGEALDLLLCSFESHGPGIDPNILPTTRALMQVSKEARKAVLAGRRLQRLDSDMYEVDVFLRGVYPPNTDSTWPLMFHKCFFVNWDIDMFYFPQNSRLDVAMFLNESRLHDIKRIAIDIDGPVCAGDMLSVPNYGQLFNRTSVRELSILPSLTTIYLVLDFHAVRHIYNTIQYMEFVESNSDEQSETDLVEQDEDNDSEIDLEEQYEDDDIENE